MLAFGVAAGLVMMLYGVLQPSLEQWFHAVNGPNKPIDREKLRWVFVTIGLLYAAFPGFMLWIRRRRYPAILEPIPDERDNEQEPERGIAERQQAADHATRRD